MKHLKFLLFAAFVLLVGAKAFAESDYDGVYAWVQGESTCYRLSDYPTVEYDGMDAILSIGGVEQLRVDVSQGELMVCFGTYVPSSVPVTISSALRGTFACPYPLDFTGLDIRAYVCTGTDNMNRAVMEQVNTVAAGTGLYVAAEVADTYDVPVYTGSEFDELQGENMLVGNYGGEMIEIDQHETIGSVQYTNYVLQKHSTDTKPRFYKVSSTGNPVADRRAYLHLPSQSVGAKEVVDIDGLDATVIETSKGVHETDGTVRKDGKYIIGQRLIIIKDGKWYDANGIVVDK